jgi:hypothetical protein
VSPPTDGGKPRPRLHDRRSSGRTSHRSSPPREPARRRSRIEAADAGQVLPPVLEHVDQGITNLARRGERSRMIPVRPHLPTPAERAIDRLGNPDSETLNTAAQSGRFCFDEEMDVISLDAEVEQPKPFGRCSRKCDPDRAEDIVAPERRKTDACPKRDVHRRARIMRVPSAMKHAPPACCRRPSRAGTSATPRRRRRELQLAATMFHLE